MSYGQLRCSDADVEAAAVLVRSLTGRGDGGESPSKLLNGARALVSVMRRAPACPVELTASPAGALIRDHLRSRQRGARAWFRMNSVLHIPPLGEPILRGGRFQAVRTNVTRARREGITCRELPESERLHVLHELDEPACLADMTVERWWVAEAQDGTPVGVAVATVDRDWAMLRILVTSGYTARYLLHTHLVGALQAAGVRYLLYRGDPFGISAGLLYLQARLGYELMKLRVPRDVGGSTKARKAPRPQERQSRQILRAQRGGALPEKFARTSSVR